LNRKQQEAILRAAHEAAEKAAKAVGSRVGEGPLITVPEMPGLKFGDVEAQAAQQSNLLILNYFYHM
jgi:hypothetical protein